MKNLVGSSEVVYNMILSMESGGWVTSNVVDEEGVTVFDITGGGSVDSGRSRVMLVA